MIDSADILRLDDCKEELHKLLKEEVVNFFARKGDYLHAVCGQGYHLLSTMMIDC